MMIKREHSFIVLLIVLLLGACSKESSGCLPPPKGFESDLIGTWGGSVETAWDSTIIISGDGRYKQIMNIKRTGFKYESDWQPWRVTYSKGLPYLHLEGLLMCAYWGAMDCTQKVVPTVGVGDTKDPFGDATYWYDVCQKDWVNTPGEGVFRILWIDERFHQPPRGIYLVPFTKSDELLPTGPAYELREP